MKELKNNKGFSLVELIIVVAIMAVLIGILAPQYLKYVERSRLSADNEYIDSVRKACEAVASDPTINLAGTKYQISFVNGATATMGGGATDVTTVFKPAVDKIADLDNDHLNSKTYASTTVTITLELSGDPEVTITGQQGVAGATPIPSPAPAP